MTDLVTWSLLVGSLLPLLISVLQQPRWPDWLRAVVTLVACLLVGAVTAFLEGALTGQSWIGSSLVILVSAMTTYRNFWKPTGVAPTIEQKTSSGDVGLAA